MDLSEPIEAIISAFQSAKKTLEKCRKDRAERKLNLTREDQVAEDRLIKTLENGPKRIEKELRRLADRDPKFTSSDGMSCNATFIYK